MENNNKPKTMTILIEYPSKKAIAIENTLKILREELRAEGKSEEEIDDIIDRFA